jgi:hypothetical protein
MDELPMMNNEDSHWMDNREKVYIVIYKKDSNSPEARQNFMNDVAYSCEKRLFKTDFPNHDIKDKDDLYKAQGGYLYVKFISEE